MLPIRYLLVIAFFSLILVQDFEPKLLQLVVAEDFDGGEEELFDDGDQEDFSEDSDEDEDGEFGDFAEDSAEFSDFDEENTASNDDNFDDAVEDDDFSDFGDDKTVGKDDDFSDDGKDENFSDFDDKDVVEESAVVSEPVTDQQIKEQQLEPVVLEEDNSENQAQQVSSFTNIDSKPNYSYEKQLFDLYEKYYKFPVSNSDWVAVSGQRKEEIYKIQKGDTLWDISATFFGDGNYWPKIWSFNKRITNPHIISTGNNILFNLGTINSPPNLSIVKGTENTNEDGNKLGSVDLSGDRNRLGNSAYLAANGDVQLPKSKVRRNRVLQLIPNSIPVWSYQPATDSSLQSIIKGKVKKKRRKVLMKYLIKENKIKRVGKVLESELTSKYALAGQYVYVQFDSKPSIEHYLVVKEMGYSKNNSDWSEVKGPFGYTYKVLGEINIGEKLEAKGVYRAYVETAMQPIAAGAFLINKDLVKFSRPQTGGDYNLISGQVIGGSFDKTTKVLYQGMYAFVNKGSSDGLEVDDKVMFVSNRNILKEKSHASGRLFKSGEGVVVDVDKNVSTIYIYKSNKEILIGDYIGEPTLTNEPMGRAQGKEDFGDDDFEDSSGDFGDGIGDDSSDDSSSDDEFGDDDFGDSSDDSGSDDEFGDDDFGDSSDDSSSDDEFGDDDFGDSSNDDNTGEDFGDDQSDDDFIETESNEEVLDEVF